MVITQYSHTNLKCFLDCIFLFQRSALTYNKNDSYSGTPGRYNIGISTGSVGASSRSSKMSNAQAYRPDGYLRKTASTTTTSPSAHFDYVPSYYRSNAETNLDGEYTGYRIRIYLSSLPTNISSLPTNISSQPTNFSKGVIFVIPKVQMLVFKV